MLWKWGLFILLGGIKTSKITIARVISNKVEKYNENMIKLIEDYVIAADFDHTVVPQIAELFQEPTVEPSSAFVEFFPTSSRVVNEKIGGHDEYRYPSQFLMEYDAPPLVDRYLGSPPSSYSTVVSERSVVAVGFITFLLLLISLQNNMILHSAQARPIPQSLLGGVVQNVGRRRRSAPTTYHRKGNHRHKSV